MWEAGGKERRSPIWMESLAQHPRMIRQLLLMTQTTFSSNSVPFQDRATTKYQHQAWLLIFARSEEAACLQHTTRWLQLSHKYDLLVLIQKYTKSSHHSKKLLSKSGDLGIGLVWDKPTGPDRTEPLFSPTVEILFKLNLIIYDGSSVVIRMISDNFRCFPVFPAVFWCFQLGCNCYG